MGSILFEVAIIVLLLIVNGIFSMSEMALVSARKARLKQRADRGDGRSLAALRLSESPDDFLATVQVGITLVGILAGAFGGATIAEELIPLLQQIRVIEAYADSIAFALVVLVITYLSLVIGELVPKRLALNHPEGIARAVAKPMQWLSDLSSPAVRLLSVSTNAVMRLLGIRPSAEPQVTEEEIKILVRQGAQSGVLEEAERHMVENIFHLGDLRVRSLMTPRRDIVWLEINDSPETIRRKLKESGMSRYPVCRGNLDNVLGTVRAKDLLAEKLADRPLDLQSALRRPLFAPETMPALRALEQFKQSGNHIAIVIDEHGGTQGLVTHHDILEAIAGEIEPIAATEDQPAVRREDGSWLLDGALSVHEFKEILGLRKLPGEDRGEYHTLGGFIMFTLGRIPSVADHFEHGGLRFEVLDMDRRRVDKVLVSAPGSTPSD
jgi:putative hemolysin